MRRARTGPAPNDLAQPRPANRGWRDRGHARKHDLVIVPGETGRDELVPRPQAIDLAAAAPRDCLIDRRHKIEISPRSLQAPLGARSERPHAEAANP
jgi:hypothetical protein